MKKINLIFCTLALSAIFFISCQNNDDNYKKMIAEVIYDITIEDEVEGTQKMKLNEEGDIFFNGWNYIAKFNKAGTFLWLKRIGSRDFATTKDGGCLTIYEKYDGLYNTREYYITKLTASGNVEWEKSGSDYKLSRIVTGENDEIFGVGDIKQVNGIEKPKFFKYTKEGEYLFSKLLISKVDLIPYVTYLMIRTRNNKLIISTINSISNERNDVDFNIIEFDTEALDVVEHHFGGTNSDEVLDVYETEDNGLLLCGVSQSKDRDIKSLRKELINTSINGWVVKLNENRKIEWEKLIGGTDGSTFLYKGKQIEGNFIVGYLTTAKDVDFNGPAYPKAGYLVIDKGGNIINNRYIESSFNDCSITKDGHLLFLSGQSTPNILKSRPRLIMVK